MTPQEFLALCLRGEKTGQTEYLLRQIQAGATIGNPFLQVEWAKDRWHVTGHEGRHRMRAIEAIAPGMPIPVHVFVRGKRASMLPGSETAPFVSQQTLWNRARRREAAHKKRDEKKRANAHAQNSKRPDCTPEDLRQVQSILRDLRLL